MGGLYPGRGHLAANRSHCYEAAHRSVAFACRRLDRGKFWLYLAFWTSLFATCAPGADPAPASFIPPGATVVLMTGIPGDIESESAYRGHLETWLEIIAANKNAARVIALIDEPKHFTGANLYPTVLNADRANFRNLAATLAGSTNPVLFVVSGHGGNQGNVPVFHVRGPRLTAADFEFVSSRMAGTDCRWILMFRGSGAFARSVAGPRSQVLSSEAASRFESDPIGMQLLLNFLRAKPAPSFEAMARELGRATAAWYSERHLARTEEPTLRNGLDKPELLAADLDDAPHASAAPQPGLDSSKPGGPASAGGDSLRTAWKGVQRVDPANVAGVDAFILRRRIAYTLGSSPAVSSEQELFIQILKPEGKRFGDFDVTYNPPFEEIHFLDCEVLGTDGKISQLDPEVIREEVPEALGDYHFGQRKFFSLPKVIPGAVLHVRYRTEWQKFPLPHISLEIPVGHELPAGAVEVQVSVPRQTPFHFLFEQIHAPDPVIEQSNYGTSYSWNFRDVAANADEPLRSPDRKGSRLLLSTFPDWATFAEWFSRVSKMTDEVTPEIAARATELTRNLTNDLERVMAIYHFVATLRYVAVPLGVNSFRPHSAANVLENQFGDCKDKANLFNTLLKAIQLESHLVLVPRFSQAYHEVPGLAFNHAISRVTLGPEALWVDLTDDVCRFGLLPPGDPGRQVLIVDGKSESLSQVPEPKPEDHQLHVSGTLEMNQSSGPWNCRLLVDARGYPDYELRAAARQARELGELVPLLALRFRPVSGAFALDKQTHTQILALGENFSCESEGIWIGTASDDPDKTVLPIPFWIPREWDLALHRRASPLFLNQGYPLVLKEEFKLKFPAGKAPGPLPDPKQTRSGPLRWRVEWVKIKDDTLSATFEAQLPKGELSAGDSVELQKALRNLQAILSRGTFLKAVSEGGPRALASPQSNSP